MKLRSDSVVLLLLVNVLALLFLHAPGTSDVGIWQRWIEKIGSYGLVGGYAQSETDYPPLSFVILAVVAKAGQVFGISSFLAIKLSLFMFLVVTTLCFYWYTRNVVVSALLQLALILNSVALGYIDSYFAPFLIAALFELQRRRYPWAMIFFVVSSLIKWQPMILLPFAASYMFDVRSVRDLAWQRLQPRMLQTLLPALCIVVPTAVVFGGPVFQSLDRATSHTFVSGNALNLNWLYTYALHRFDPQTFGPIKKGVVDLIITQDASVMRVPKLLFFVAYIAIWIMLLRKEKTFEQFVLFALLGYLAYFMFNTGVHENHWFIPCLLVAVLLSLHTAYLRICINVIVAANTNLLVFYGVAGKSFAFSRVIMGIDITLLLSLINLLLFGGLAWRVVRGKEQA